MIVALRISQPLLHLTELGHTRIGYVGQLYKYADRRQDELETRRKLFNKLMKRRGLYQEELIIDCYMDIGSTIEGWKEHLRLGKPLPTAVFCANEENAMGTLKQLQQEGYSIPGDISVVSFNDTPRSALVSPSLTSVSINTTEMANAALRMLAERAGIAGKEPVRTLPLKVIVPPSIVIRESTARV